MSKNNNVNPGSYKTAGREPQGQDVPHDVARQEYAQEKAREKQEEFQTADREKAKKASPESQTGEK